MSHVLEHMKNPIDVLNNLKKCQMALIAVPNPIRPKILFKYYIFNNDYANKGYLYSWDQSHFTNFITRSKLKIGNH